MSNAFRIDPFLQSHPGEAEIFAELASAHRAPIAIAIGHRLVNELCRLVDVHKRVVAVILVIRHRP